MLSIPEWLDPSPVRADAVWQLDSYPTACGVGFLEVFQDRSGRR